MVPCALSGARAEPQAPSAVEQAIGDSRPSLADPGFADLLQRVDAARARQDPAAALQILMGSNVLLAEDVNLSYLLGVVALEAGQPLVALEALERVLLWRPGFAGAWLDLAVAHARLGDWASALAILDHVETEFSPPPVLREQIAAVRRNLTVSPERGSAGITAWRGDLLLLAGHTSNANSGLTVGSFSITPFGAEPQRVVVAPVQRPRSDAQLQTRSMVYRDFPGSDGSVTTVLGAVKGRLLREEGEFGVGDFAASVSHSRPMTEQRAMVVGVGARAVTLGGVYLGAFFSTNLGMRHYLRGGCVGSASVEYERRAYQRDTYTDANLYWLGGAVECQRERHEFSLAARVGMDLASGMRAGGDTTRAEGNALWRWKLGGGWRSEFLVYVAYGKDSASYSALLVGGAERQLHRIGQRLSISKDLDPATAWRAVVEIENTRDISNLPIFRTHETQATAGLRYVF